jgi:excisionase family DNA binding protein
MQGTTTEKQTGGVFCRAPEAAKHVPMALRTFHLKVAQGIIPSYKFGRQRLFKKDEVIAAIERYRVATTSEVLS